MGLVDGFVKRRLKARAIERARFQLQHDHGLGGAVLEGATFALEAVDDAHGVPGHYGRGWPIAGRGEIQRVGHRDRAYLGRRVGAVLQ